ncbi:2-polyprenyl-6-hydroxyphenyl methylase/3-demethylubiquinone-9 3-methyltransferase [Salinibacter ruber]|uniref:class I SAM-dependent methyltransferase n=3 Tax=Salinibacter ruber TaxID=146919 RepID=UPI0021680014|nr:2-polyprenyl-6-hydroxyphenyl methylase/3-demethylubiquinone-9 3-methyltransferase [Salinibacter ruber]
MDTENRHASDYSYSDSECGHAHSYLLPKVEDILKDLAPASIFDLGCGNGSVAAYLEEDGYEITGVDPSEDGIQQARRAYPNLDVHVGSAYDDLADEYGQYDVTLSLEVVEHVYSPTKYAKTVFNLTRPGGHAVISTPYHGYLKNLLIALKGAWGKDHYSPLWKNGHIKIWTPKTLRKLIRDAGFRQINTHRVGRLPPIAKSIILSAKKPESRA